MAQKFILQEVPGKPPIIARAGAETNPTTDVSATADASVGSGPLFDPTNVDDWKRGTLVKKVYNAVAGTPKSKNDLLTELAELDKNRHSLHFDDFVGKRDELVAKLRELGLSKEQLELKR